MSWTKQRKRDEAPPHPALRATLSRREKGSKPLSRRGDKALLARHWRACLGARAPQARAGARSGGWGEGTVRKRSINQRPSAMLLNPTAPYLT
ncbi:hypothetical protein XHV734_3672 [Xanthomonas hortorum pv. vitians]|nr:hypothetical protein XHV734_3672 [Xanthomonas hortorum pv. vitians]